MSIGGVVSRRAIGRLRNSDPDMPKRQGVATPFVMPTRGPMETLAGPDRSSRRNGGLAGAAPSRAPLIFRGPPRPAPPLYLVPGKDDRGHDKAGGDQTFFAART